MSTFKELNERLLSAKARITLKQYLLDHIDSEFRPAAGAAPKKVLVTEDKLPVTEAAIESVVKDLSIELEDLYQEVNSILGAPVFIPGQHPNDPAKVINNILNPVKKGT